MASVTWDDLNKTDDLQELESIYRQLCYTDALRRLIDTNLIDIFQGTNQYFVFRVYFWDLDNEKWEFYRYCRLTKEGQLLGLGTDLKSLTKGTSQTVAVFHRNAVAVAQMRPRPDSENHLVVLVGKQRYLFHSKYPEVIRATLNHFN